MDQLKCTREWHDAYGAKYEDCMQCFIRDNGPWSVNPYLMPANEFDEAIEQFKKEAEEKLK